MSQIARFNDGGFVLHKCLGKRLSAWYDKNGVLKDHELIDSVGRSRKASKHDVGVLITLGNVWKQSNQ